MNENYAHPAMPEGAEEGIIKGMYLLKTARRRKPRSAADGLGRDLARGRRGGGLLKDFGVPPMSGA